MAVRFEVYTDKLRRACWGHGKDLAKRIGVSSEQLSRKLNQHQPFLVSEINVIIEALDLDARDYVFFVDTDKKAEIKKAA